jgi:peptidoglycan hydrolase-like protein with peptidoglycan-binding domain
MECSNLIKSAIDKGGISTKLSKGSRDKVLIKDLQRTLFELGFRKQLKWDSYQADGLYGNATMTAVRAFADRNNISSDGNKVTKDLAEVMIQRHEFLPSMYLLWEIHQSDLRTRKFISKGTKMSIIAIQVLLNELGYTNSQTGAKLDEDGLYGPETNKTFIAFAQDNNIVSDGDQLSRPLINLIIKEINKFYGDDWSKLAVNNMPKQGSPLRIYQNSRFVGRPCRADVQFLPMLDKINQYAEDANVFIHVTSSFRTTTNVQGAIVKPATFSNHLVGHGIDMNVKFGNTGFANSSVLVEYPNVPPPVKQFLDFIIADPKLRWGGKFNAIDPVHIDDGLNQNRPVWDKRYEVMQRAVQLGET